MVTASGAIVINITFAVVTDPYDSSGPSGCRSRGIACFVGARGMNPATQKNTYQAQLDVGFSLLRFEHHIEQAYQAHHVRHVQQEVLAFFSTAMILVMSAMAIVSADDFSRVPAWIATAWTWVAQPLLVILLMVSVVPKLYRIVWPTVAPAIVGVCGVIGAYHVAILVAAGQYHAFFSMSIALTAAYVLMGLLFWHVVAAAAVVSVAYSILLAKHAIDPVVYRVELVQLAIVNVIGLLAAYFLEHRSRSVFLKTRVLELYSSQDALTGLLNRGVFDRQLDMAWKQAMRERQTVGLILLDVDHFKHYNDHYGHQAGDEVLKQVAQTLKDVTRRPLDCVARYGGEEFAIILYGTRLSHVENLAEFVRQSVEQLALPHARSQVSDVVTISVGAAVIEPVAGRSAEGFVQFVDELLYDAKRAGRNRVESDQKSKMMATGRFRNVAAGKGSS